MSSQCETEARRILDRSILAMRSLPVVGIAPEAVAQRIVSCLARDDFAGARDLLPTRPTTEKLASAIVSAARQAEALWKQELLDFDATVTVFAGLEHLLRHPDGVHHAPTLGPRLLLAVPKGDMHSLGVRIASLRFADAGISVRTEAGISMDDLLDLVAAGVADAVGLSVGTDAGLEGLAETIAHLRNAAPNPGMPVLLGGAAITLTESAYTFAGADLVTNDTTAAAALVSAASRHTGHVN